MEVNDFSHQDVEQGNTRKEVATTTVVVDLTAEELKRNRTFMTIFHFVLTYPRWSFSLFLLLASGSLPGTLPTAEEAVQEPIKNLRALVLSESEAYHKCTVHAFDAAAEILNETAKLEWGRVLDVREQNLRLVREDISTSVDSCIFSTQVAHEGLKQWYQQQNRHDAVPWIIAENTTDATGNETCTEQDRDLLVGGLFQSQEAEMIGLMGQVDERLNSWRSRTLDTTTQLAQFTKRRTAYDYDYFVGLKHENVLQQLKSFELNTRSVKLPSIPEQQLMEQIRAFMESLIDILDDAKARIDLLDGRLRDFHASIKGFRENYLDLYNRLALASDFVSDFLPPSIKIPSFLDMSAVPVADMLMPTIYEVPRFNADLPEINLDHMLQSIIALIQSTLRQALIEISAEFQDLLDQLLVSLQALLSLDDYDPPKFNGNGSMDDEILLLDQDNAHSQQEIAQLMADSMIKAPTDQLGRTSDEISVIFDLDAPEYPDVDGGSTTSFAYLQPSLPSLSIPEAILWFFSFVIAHQWIIEAVIQCFRILRLKRKYERDATPDLPEIDLASDNEDEKYNQSTWSLAQVALLEHLLTPWMMIGLVLFPFALVAVTLWLPHVKQNCIDTRNGTFIAHNMFVPILINEASLTGNAYHTQGELKCRQAQQTMCSTKFQQSDQLYREDSLAVHTLEAQYNQSRRQRDTFTRCIDLEVLDGLFSEACCGLDGYTTGCSGRGMPSFCPIDNRTIPASAFQPVGVLLTEETCPSELKTPWSLDDSRFNCSELRDVCSSRSCSGIDHSRLENTTIETDCDIETYIIKCCALVLLALYHGIMVNLISSLAFNGVKHLRWRNLRPDGIKFRTNVDEDGKLIKGNCQLDRSFQIKAALRRFELLGEVQLALSVAMFAIWFLSFFVLRYFLQKLFHPKMT